jgi:hypothetical protein
MPTPQVFTLEAVNALIPRLSELVGRQLVRRASIEDKLKALSDMTGEVPEDLTPRRDDVPYAAKLKQELTEEVTCYQEGWQELEEMGAVLKDPRLGLVDFYGQVDGKRVFLCWKYGEEEIAYYHNLDEGFSGRKAIGVSVKQRLLN